MNNNYLCNIYTFLVMYMSYIHICELNKIYMFFSNIISLIYHMILYYY